jgi:hypothetical protein
VTRKRIILYCILAAVGVVGYISAYSALCRHRAQSLASDVVRLKIGNTTAEELDELAREYPWSFSVKRCGNEGCEYGFSVANRGLSLLRAEPFAEFDVYLLTSSKGHLNSIHTKLYRDTRIFPTAPSGGFVDESMEDVDLEENAEMFRIGNPVGKPYLAIHMKQGASEVQRRLAYSFSFRCLTTLKRNCDLPCDYLPDAWAVWEKGLRSEGFNPEAYYHNLKRCKQNDSSLTKSK